ACAAPRRSRARSTPLPRCWACRSRLLLRRSQYQIPAEGARSRQAESLARKTAAILKFVVNRDDTGGPLARETAAWCGEERPPAGRARSRPPGARPCGQACASIIARKF